MNNKRLIGVSAVIMFLAGSILFVLALIDKEYTRVALGCCFVTLGIIHGVKYLPPKNKTDENDESKE